MISAFAVNPKHLGGQLGMTAVLHTWGERLAQHVHLHCLIPGGALSAEGNWRAARGNYLFPKRALSRRFRGRMVSALRAAYRHGELHRLTGPAAVDALLDELMRIRHYGFLANRCRRTKLAQIRTALAHMVPQTACAETDDEATDAFDGYPCPKCRIGRLRVIGLLVPLRFEGG